MTNRQAGPHDDSPAEDAPLVDGAPPPPLSSPLSSRMGGAFARHPNVAAPVAALVLGALAACGFAPLGLWPLALLGVGGLVLLVARAPGWRRAAGLGWCWGLGHFTLGLGWIATAFTYQAKMPVWLGWGAVAGLAAYLALFPTFAALGGWGFRRRPLALAMGFAGCWVVSEWLRGWLFTGFAWNPLGVVLLGGFGGHGLAWLAAWLGTYGLSGVVAGVSGFWAMALAWGWQSGRLRLLGCGFVAFSLCLAALMTQQAAPPPAGGTIAYTLVQPNISQAEINDASLFDDQFARTARLSTPLRPGQPRLVLWPESGVMDYLREGYPAWAYRDTYAGDPALARARLGRVAGPGSLLLTGATDLVMTGDRLDAWRNVVTVVDARGRIAGSYAKAHLVPYGEYLPLRGLLGPLGLARLVPVDVDDSPGPGPQTLNLGAPGGANLGRANPGRAGMAICYEIVFSGEVVDRQHRPDFIFNPTNDGWFGAWGPPQHLAQARLRAVEEGLPVLRSTVNGISAVIDADGVVRGFIPHGVAGRLDGLVPPAHPPTLFARYGNTVPLCWAMLFLVGGWLVLRRAKG